MLSSVLQVFGLLIFSFAWLSFDHYRPWVNFHAEAMAIFGMGLLITSRLIDWRMKSHWKVPASSAIIFALSALPWLYWMAGVSLFAGDALICSLYLSSFAAAIALGYSYSQDTRDGGQGILSIFYLIWFVALISAGIGLLQWLTLQDVLQMYVVQTDPGDRAMGNLGQPNQLATLLLMGICALAWTFERKRIGFAGLICGVAFMTLVLVLTQSRAGILSAMAVAILLGWKSYKATNHIRPWHLAVWLVAFLIMLQILPHLHEFLLMSEGRNLSLTRDNGRYIIWKQVFAGIMEAPWFGYGWNQTPTAHAMGAVAHPGSMTYTNAHNVLLDLIAWNGLPIGILLISACIYWVIARLRRVSGVNGIYAIASLVPVVVHSLLEYPFAYSYFLLTAGLAIGIVEASISTSSRSFRINTKVFASLLVVVLLLGSRLAYEYLLVEEDFRVVRFENLRIGQTPSDYHPPENIWLLSQMGAMLDAGRLRPERGMPADDIENLRKTSLRFPYGALALRYVQALGLNDQPEKATQQMQIIRGMYGQYYYDAAVHVLRSMEHDQYPELNKVITP